MRNSGNVGLNKTGLEQNFRKSIRKRYFLYLLLGLFCFLVMFFFFLWLKAPKLGMKANEFLSSQGNIIYVSTFPWDSESEGIFLINANGTGRRQILDYQDEISDIAVSPNGQQIVFSSKDEVGESIYSIKVDSTELVQLTDSSWANNQSVWSPDGGSITFVHAILSSDPYAYTEAIYQMDPDGSNLRKLADSHDRVGWPIWSPDGSYIAYYADKDIYIMLPNGEGKTRITDGDAREEAVSWSPDSSCIAYTSTNESNQNIHIVNIDGSSNVQLTHNEEDDFSPAWSPDGSRIAYTAVYTKFDPKLHFYRIEVLDLNSREIKTVLSTKPSPNPYDWQGYFYPVWSPDGKWMIGLGGDLHQTIGMSVVNVENPMLRKLIDDELDDLVWEVIWVR
jgi:TolB protein